MSQPRTYVYYCILCDAEHESSRWRKHCPQHSRVMKALLTNESYARLRVRKKPAQPERGTYGRDTLAS